MDDSIDLTLPEFEFLDSFFKASEQTRRGKIYSLESLIRDISKIKIIREKIVRHCGYNDIEIKEERRYSLDKEISEKNKSISLSSFKKKCKISENELNELIHGEYVRINKTKLIILGKFRNCLLEDFHLNLDKERERKIFKTLDSFLWEKISAQLPDGSPHLLWEIMFSNKFLDMVVSDTETDGYLFRQGNTIFVIDFYQKPTVELLELIQLRISLISQEKMPNYFQIISTYSADIAQWFKKDKRFLFYETVGNFLNYTWRPFDLEEIKISISGARGVYAFARGGIYYRFNREGEPSWEIWGKNSKETKLKDINLEFLSRSIQVTINKETIDPITIDLYLKSRSFNNVDPVSNILLHNFIKQISEALGKLIDVVIPIIQMEKAEETLKWRTFFDKLRIQALNYGENIDLIMADSLRIIKWFFNVTEVIIFIENPELIKMINIYQSMNETKDKSYLLLQKSLEQEDIYRKNLIPVLLNEEQNERIIMYLAIPKSKNSSDYLVDSEIYIQIREEAEKTNIKKMDETLMQILTTSLSYNPTITLSNIASRWPKKDKNVSNVVLALAQRLLGYYSVFFDLLVSIHANLESGISRMRASRDRLTGLYNRQAFTSILERFYNTKSRSFGLMFIDMDSFKIFNDAISHHFGDKILIKLADILLQAGFHMPYRNIAGRFGGDEFCFAVSEISEVEFELLASRLFKMITGEAIEINFYLENRREGSGFDVNMISFLHRLVRPDVGGHRDEITGYTEKAEESPRGHIINIFRHYAQSTNDADFDAALDDLLFKKELSKKVSEKICNQLLEIIKEKLIKNYICQKVDEDMEKAVRLFILLQLENRSTDEIRTELVKAIGRSCLKRTITIRISCGLAHSKEYRLRSVSSLFKAADNRAYIAKHNGKNCLFGVDSQKLV